MHEQTVRNELESQTSAMRNQACRQSVAIGNIQDTSKIRLLTPTQEFK